MGAWSSIFDFPVIKLQNSICLQTALIAANSNKPKTVKVYVVAFTIPKLVSIKLILMCVLHGIPTISKRRVWPQWVWRITWIYRSRGRPFRQADMPFVPIVCVPIRLLNNQVIEADDRATFSNPRRKPADLHIIVQFWEILSTTPKVYFTRIRDQVIQPQMLFSEPHLGARFRVAIPVMTKFREVWESWIFLLLLKIISIFFLKGVAIRSKLLFISGV